MTSGFWSMGGYARYVWPCFLLAAAVLSWNLWAARRLHRAALSRVRRALAMAAAEPGAAVRGNAAAARR